MEAVEGIVNCCGIKDFFAVYPINKEFSTILTVERLQLDGEEKAGKFLKLVIKRHGCKSAKYRLRVSY